MVRVDHVLNARQLLCPMPVIRTQERVSKLSDGDVLEVICSDPGALVDIPAWCRVHGHEVLDTQSTQDEIIVRLKVARDEVLNTK